jgi:type I restriction enzyme R subunit
VITSYNPQAGDVTLEETGANTETDKQVIRNTYLELLEGVEPRPGKTRTETYEEDAKKLFRKQPAKMKLLVVVDKLLTGFDAPPCSYLYIDKSMQDHGLFQAICRTNRLDGEDKTSATSSTTRTSSRRSRTRSRSTRLGAGPERGRRRARRVAPGSADPRPQRLDNAIDALVLLCEPVEPPKGELEHIHYFCGNTEIASDLQEREPRRAMLYKATVASMVRAYANIADELERPAIRRPGAHIARPRSIATT